MNTTEIINLITDSRVNLSFEEIKILIDEIYNDDILKSYIIKQRILNIILNADNNLVNKIYDKLVKRIQTGSFMSIGVAHILDLLSDCVKSKILELPQIIELVQDINNLNIYIFEQRFIDTNNVAMFSVIKICRRCLKYLIEINYKEQKDSTYSSFIEILKTYLKIIQSNFYPSYLVNKILVFILIFSKTDIFKFNLKYFVMIFYSFFDLAFYKLKLYMKANVRYAMLISRNISKKYRKILTKNKFSVYRKKVKRYRNFALVTSYKKFPLEFLRATNDQQIFIGKNEKFSEIDNKNCILLNKIILQNFILIFMCVSHRLLVLSAHNTKICNTLFLLERFLSHFEFSLHDEIFVFYSFEYKYEQKFNHLILLFAGQDDVLINILLSILEIQDWVQENSIFNANMRFIDFLRILNFDWSILLDFLVSPETEFLKYILLQLKRINLKPQCFKALFNDHNLNEYLHFNEEASNIQRFKLVSNVTTENLSNFKLTVYSDSENEDSFSDSNIQVLSNQINSTSSGVERSDNRKRNVKMNSFGCKTNICHENACTRIDCLADIIKCLRLLKEKLEWNLQMENPIINYNIKPLIKQLKLFIENMLE